MKVQIVLSDYQNDLILPRLARCLSETAGWPMATRPNPNVDLNLFLVYIDYAESNSTFTATPTAAWFTHLEKGHQLKEKWWRQAGKGVDLRLTSARMYADDLSQYGPTKQVRPPVDRNKFTIVMDRVRESVPIVGLSGFIPKVRNQKLGKSRKGESLVARLAQSDFGKGKMRLVASGQGWPVRRQSMRTVDQLPAFFQGLDVFLCTSLIEGIPMPPLEALSCGVPVVIPRGVGLLDELPQVPGIWRFDRGDYGGMVKALQAALEWLPEMRDDDRAALRSCTADFTPENWAGDIKRAIEGLLLDVPAEVEVKAAGRRGVYYVAYGAPSRRMATRAITSFKQHVEGVEAALVGSEPLGPEDVFIEHPDVDIGGRCAKTKIFDLAPAEWDVVLYLDADTEVIADISFLYQILDDGWDMVICKNPVRFHVIRNMVRPDNGEECAVTFKQLGSKELLQLNGGVVGFRRNERTAAFFRAWHDEWQRWGSRDQAALLRALWNNPVRLFVLSNHWNLVPEYNNPSDSAGILHHVQKARRWEGLIHGRADGKDAWQTVKEWEAKRK